MYVYTVDGFAFYLDLLGLLLIVHEIRAQLKMDTQNVVRRLYNGRWAKAWMYQLQCDWWVTCMRLWGKAMGYLSANILVMWYLQINSWTEYVPFPVLGVLNWFRRLETWMYTAFGNNMERMIYQWHVDRWWWLIYYKDKVSEVKYLFPRRVYNN